MKKPEKKIFKPVYEYNEIVDFIDKKYNIKTDNYKNKNGERKSLWGYLSDNCSGNGTFMYLPDPREEWYKSDPDEDDTWLREIMGLIQKEFFPDDEDGMMVWVSW